MKKYALYPGRGRVSPDGALVYVTGRQLAACYRVPYSDCLDTDIPSIKKVISFGATRGAPPIHLLHLVPNSAGYYKLPSSLENKIIVVKGLHESVNKNG